MDDDTLSRDEFETIWLNFNYPERQVATLLLRRLFDGRASYGSWQPGDGRDGTIEALEELVDGQIYIAMRLVELARKEKKDKP